MPVTIKSAAMKFKAANGSYIGIDAIADATTAQQVAAVSDEGDAQKSAIQTEGAAQQAAIVAKGAETLESIPSEYTELSNDVNSLKSAVTNLETNIDPVLTSNPPYYALFRRDHNYKYTCLFNMRDYKNSTKQYFVDPVNGNNDNAGTYKQPLKTVAAAYAKEDVTEIVLFQGIYAIADWFGSGNQLSKPISISTFMGGTAKYVCGAAGNFTLYDETNHVYRMYSTNAAGVIDLNSRADNGNYVRFDLTSSLETIADGQYFVDSSDYVYIRCDAGVTGKNLYVLKKDRFGLSFRPTNGGILTVENVEFIGGACAVDIRCLDASGANKTYGYFENCKFTNAVPSSMWESANGLNALSAETICINCEAAYNYDDGFNYHLFGNISSTKVPIACEYKCKGHHNGVTSGTDNGSTIHDGGRIIRVSCEYNDNMGPNVADVHTGTVTWNYDVYSHHALASGANFSVTQESARMILVDCIADNADTAVKVGTSGTSNAAYILRGRLNGALDKATSCTVVFK